MILLWWHLSLTSSHVIVHSIHRGLRCNSFKINKFIESSFDEGKVWKCKMTKSEYRPGGNREKPWNCLKNDDEIKVSSTRVVLSILSWNKRVIFFCSVSTRSVLPFFKLNDIKFIFYYFQCGIQCLKAVKVNRK